MKRFIALASYLFHPLLMPLVGILLYFWLTKRFYPTPVIKAKILAVVIFTVIIPLIFYFILKNSKLISSAGLPKVKERKIPLLFYATITLTIINFIFPKYQFNIPYLFFSGILYATLLVLIGTYFKQKISLHMVGIAGLCTFIIGICIYFGLPLYGLIAFFIFATGWTASARLQAKAHNHKELILGIIAGGGTQLGLFLLYL